MADVFLHVGLPKTGTTTLQAALDHHVDDLAAGGVLFPGGRHEKQRLAVFDLLGQRLEGDERAVAGAFQQLVEEMAAYDGHSIIVTEEILGMARPRQVRRFVDALPKHRVHVVISARDLGRTLVSAWQQTVVMGGTTTWQEFADEVRTPGAGRASDGAGFAMRHDLLRVLDLWGEAVPAEQMRLVTVPPPGSPRPLLLERFSQALDLPAGLLSDAKARNESLGAAETELIRRLNPVLGEKLKTRQYRYVLEIGLRPRWENPDSRRLALPAADHEWVAERAGQLVEQLAGRGLQVFGELDDLVPQPGADEPRLDEVSDAELLAAAEAAVVALSVSHGKLFTRFRGLFKEQEGRAPSAAETVGSTLRASTVKAKKRAVAGADRNRVLAWALRRYVARKG